MSYKIFIRPEAEIDLNEAYFWYESQKAGLGKELVFQIDTCIASIQRNPFSYPFKYKKVVRGALVHRFPYSVFYVVEQQTIVVIAVFHAKRDPRVWQDRI
ncbi:type II toxin-antitoxin system RelE/ParE family toxin [candidate division KSB1 bacterium]|nr:type II toxin-antitoxin system RelE/ParE family toxin [candidate division KSB1 bacterium]